MSFAYDSENITVTEWYKPKSGKALDFDNYKT